MMTFAEWWARTEKAYNTEKELAEMAWQAATEAERERAAKIIASYLPHAPNKIRTEVLNEMFEKIRQEEGAGQYPSAIDK